jgi:CheY-like chemotaxis protein
MRATLLLADDSVTIQRVIELTFANEDVRVITVSDGQQALEQIDSQRPDIVLADVSLPKVDGYGISSHVKESAELKGIPVLLLTGAFEPIDDDKARECKCDSVLIKPFEPQDLIGRVRELLMPKEETAKRAVAAAEPAQVGSPASTVTAVLEPPALAAVATIEAPARSVIEPIPFSQIDDDDFEMDLDRFHQQFVQPGPAGGQSNSTTVGDGLDVSHSEVHPAPTGPNQASFGDWDIPKRPPALPDMKAEPSSSLVEPAPSASVASQPPSPAAVPSPPVPDDVKPASASASEKVSIASAFSALLAAEQPQPARFSHPLPSISEAAIEQVVHRVLARLSEETVRKIVLENAERIIRQEIERIKSE